MTLADGTQGISAGCFDEYAAGLQCQWLDITGLPDGTYFLKVTVNPLTTTTDPEGLLYETDYTNNTATAQITITGNAIAIPDKFNQVIRFNGVPNRAYGDPPRFISPSVDTQLPLTIGSTEPSVAVITQGSKLTITGAGTTDLVISQAGNGIFNAAELIYPLSVAKVSLAVTPAHHYKAYGQPNPQFTLTYGNFVNGDNVSNSITTPPITSSTATLLSPVGNYPITLSGGLSKNYNFVFNEGTLTVQKALLTAQANNSVRPYGQNNPELTLTYTGFINGDNADDIIPPVASVTATSSSDAGEYPIVLTGGDAQNYSLQLENGILTVVKADQTIDFPSLPQKQIGDPITTLHAVASSNLPVAFSSNDPSKAVVNNNQLEILKPGNVTITASQSGNHNYNAATVSQELCIRPAKPIISKDAANPRTPVLLSSAATGNQWYKNGTLIIGATNNTYTVSENNNYTVTSSVDNCVSEFSDETIVTIPKTMLSVKADNKSRAYGANNPELTATYTGFINGENIGDITPPVASVPATPSSDIGEYPIILSGGSAQYYYFQLENGVLTVIKANQTIDFPALPQKQIGDPITTLHAVASSNLPVAFSSNDPSKAVVNNNQLELLKPGNVTITASQSGNKNYNPVSVSQQFCINPAKPIITQDFTDPDAPVFISSATTGNQWYRNDTAISGATNSTYTVMEVGNYTVTSAIDNCVSEVSEGAIVIVTSTDLTSKASIMVYPNPVDHELEIGLTDSGRKEIDIVNVRGETMHHTSSTSTHVIVQTGLWPSGTYILKIQSVRGLHHIKIIKK